METPFRTQLPSDRYFELRKVALEKTTASTEEASRIAILAVLDEMHKWIMQVEQQANTSC